MSDTGTGVQSRKALFELLGNLDTFFQFFDHVSDSVTWVVVGEHPLGGVYTSKQDLLDGTIAQVNARTGGLCYDLKQIFEDGSTVIVVMQGVATALDGKPYDSFYVWFCRFEGDEIVEVHAYPDSALVISLMERVQPKHDVPPVRNEPQRAW
ncbi:hypothetical protein DFR70_1011237 [Nocardia tenerifensis]|uniref:SnoaL-like domain-containing protein n=1 Tax=Nocardia tenerifensis TaxID=228006 RepID=A0A318KI21_9NOCA|nr:hypothetical protein [Nocardia tenerifensis]PXX71803.1 hypothetical protein DFR70_1011237 [Nocardia tenerifensis]